jgi:methyl-accepting chemotaxis protein
MLILAGNHIQLLEQHIQLSKQYTISAHSDSTPTQLESIHKLKSEIVFTQLSIVMILLSMLFVIMVTIKSAKDQSSKLHKMLIEFNLGRFDSQLLAHKLGDLATVAGEMNLLGLHQERTRKKVSDAMAEVICASAEMGKVVQQSADGTDQQLQAVSRVAAAIEQMSNSMKHAADNAAHTNKMSEETASLAGEGEAKVKQMHHEMISINKVVDATTEAIDSLQQRSQEVSQIINVIQGIAEQTNLLALNAAIESARAGEQGRGFAVVADEVRNLATKTSGATTEIGELINKMQSEVTNIVDNISSVRSSVDSGVSMSSQAEHSLTDISQRAKETKDMIAEISSSLSQQESASSEIANSIHRISDMAQVNKNSIEETDSAASYLEQMSKNLLNDIRS